MGKSVNRKEIPTPILRKLYAESMGRCMNPACRIELFGNGGDIGEKAHIDAYCETEDNSFSNLVILCPNCHKKYDKLHEYTDEEVRNWKKDREKLFKSIFEKKYATFDDLKERVVPLLEKNKIIFENYYLGDNKNLWDDFQDVIISNNLQLKEILNANLHLFQNYKIDEYSNLHLINKFIAHIDEFEITREEKEKQRSILFPKEIESIFGINPIKGRFFLYAETIESLISILKDKKTFSSVNLGVNNPYIKLNNGEYIFLNDAPRLRQVFHDNNVKYASSGLRFESLNFVLKYLNDRNIKYSFSSEESIKSVFINNDEYLFVYEYCLSKEYLQRILPKPNITIVNLHHWNDNLCISKDARSLAEDLEVKLLTQKEFFDYVKKYRNNRNN